MKKSILRKDLPELFRVFLPVGLCFLAFYLWNHLIPSGPSVGWWELAGKVAATCAAATIVAFALNHSDFIVVAASFGIVFFAAALHALIVGIILFGFWLAVLLTLVAIVATVVVGCCSLPFLDKAFGD
jgi:hypothetical protein